MNWTRIAPRRLPLSLALPFLLLVTLAGGQSAPQAADAKPFRVMTYNIHHGEGLDGKVDLQRIADLIKQRAGGHRGVAGSG